MESYIQVHFLRENRTAHVPMGKTLVEAAASTMINIYAPCGDRGICGKCRVQIPAGDGLTPLSDAEFRRLNEEDRSNGWRLACQAKVLRECQVRTPDDSMQMAMFARFPWVEPRPFVRKILLEMTPPTLEDQRADVRRVYDAVRATIGDENYQPTMVLDVMRRLPKLLPEAEYRVTAVLAGDKIVALEPGDTTDILYGIAVDLGTTTVVGALVNLLTGENIGQASTLNAQANFGADVIARSALVMNEEWGMQEMQSKGVASVNNVVEQLCEKFDVRKDQIYEMVLVGNTAMNHLFLGLDPISLSHAPYWPVLDDPITLSARAMGVAIHVDAPVTWLPNIAGFVGSDALAVILSTDLHRTDKVELAVDIGTNGEMSLAAKGKLLTCSTPAGPAFEGARISCGMRGTTGAIEKVEIDGEKGLVRVSVIGKSKAEGVCGSGLIDAVAQMLKVGLIDSSGRMIKREAAEGKLHPRLVQRLVQTEEGPGFELAPKIVLTQRDVRELQLAKAAIQSGCMILMQDLELKDEDLDMVFLAGAFGNYVNPLSARLIGLVPNIKLDRIVGVGNAAGAGALMSLISTEKRQEAYDIPKKAEFIELSARVDFADAFMEAIRFPNWNETAEAD